MAPTRAAMAPMRAARDDRVRPDPAAAAPGGRPVSTWTPDELATFGDPDEIGIASLRADGSARPFITIWIARLGDELYVRSAYGPENGWYRRAVASGLGRIRAGGRERDIAFETPGPEVDEPLHAAYHAKYDRYGRGIVGTVISDQSARSTLRLVPRGA
jgi:hypothetical protein